MKQVLSLVLVAGVAFMLGHFLRGPIPLAGAVGGGAEMPSGNGDVNGDGTIDISDGIYILNWLFIGGKDLVAIECPLPGGGALPATGQTECIGNVEGQGWMVLPCASTDFSGQDGAYQAGCPMAGRFVDNGDGTVTDMCTGLLWQKDTADISGDGSIGQWPDSEDAVYWEDALEYCEGLSLAGHDDWRLPNVREIQSIVDYGRVDPAIDPAFGTVPFFYWSSTPGAHDPDNVWYVDFEDGRSYSNDDRGDHFYVRAVRNAP